MPNLISAEHNLDTCHNAIFSRVGSGENTGITGNVRKKNLYSALRLSTLEQAAQGVVESPSLGVFRTCLDIALPTAPS